MGAVATPASLDALVSAAAGGAATSAELAVLEGDPVAWAAPLRRLLYETEDELPQVRRMTGPERDQVVADFEEERRSLASALTRLTGETIPPPAPPAGSAAPAPFRAAPAPDPEAGAETGPARLQLSWDAGRVVAWAGSRDGAAVAAGDVEDLLMEAGAPSAGWAGHTSVILPDGTRADAVASQLPAVLGWLVALGG